MEIKLGGDYAEPQKDKMENLGILLQIHPPVSPQDLSKHNSCSSSPDSTGFMETLLSVVIVCHDTPPCFSRLSLILLLSLLHLLFPLPGKLMIVTMLSFSS